MTSPNEKTALTDKTNVQMVVIEDTGYDVATAYALLAGTQRPPVLRGEDLAE
jgi:hypothetical protein